MSPKCICFLVVWQVFKACNVVSRRCKYCLLCICNILNLCNAGSAFTIYLTCVTGRKEELWQYLHNDGYVFPKIVHFCFVFPYVISSFGMNIHKFIVPISGSWHIQSLLYSILYRYNRYRYIY